MAVVFDEAELAELVHEIVDPRTRRPDTRSHHRLFYGRGDSAHSRLLADLGQHDKQARKPLLARIEKLVDEIRFDLAVPARPGTPRGPHTLIKKHERHSCFA